MARSYNRITILGNIGQDPDVNETRGGNKVANFSVATSPPWDSDKAEWHRVTAWRKLADIVEEYARKGDRIFVEGRLQYNSWEDKDGNRRVSAEINAQNIVLLGSRRSGGSLHKPQRPKQQASDDELPF